MTIDPAGLPLGTILRDPETGRLAVRFQQQDDTTGKGMHAWYVPASAPAYARVLHHVEVTGWHEVELPPGVADVVRAALERESKLAEANGRNARFWSEHFREVDDANRAALGAHHKPGYSVAELITGLVGEMDRLTRELGEAQGVLMAINDTLGLPAEALDDPARIGRALREQLASRPAIPADAVEPGVVNHLRPVKVSADRVEVEVSTRASDGTTRVYVREWDRKGGCRQVGLILTDEKRAELVARLSAPVSGSDTATDGYCKVKIWPTWTHSWAYCSGGFGSDGRCLYGHKRPDAPRGSGATDGGDRG